MLRKIVPAIVLMFTASSAAASDLAFMADERGFAVAYTAEQASDRTYHIVVISNVGALPLDIRLGKGERPNVLPYATLAPGAAASFVTLDSLFVSCATKACRTPVEVNYLPAY